MKHRALIAFAGSLAMVVVLATLLPRVYLVNDDVGLTDYLRRDQHVSWMSPSLARALGFAYRHVPDVPWYGLYLYALLVIGGAVLIHTCSELVDRRDGPGRVATLLGVQVFVASHAIFVVGITWTTASIAAVGIGSVAFLAHAHGCRSTGAAMAWRRTLIYGLLVAGGYALRSEGLDAVAVALAPVAGWTVLRFARRRHVPRVAAMIAFAAPFAIVLAVQGQISVAQESAEFEAFNDARGRLHGHIRFAALHQRGPELLARAGWTVEDYNDFGYWLFLDERKFSIDKMQRLVATGGVPQAIDARWSYDQLRGVLDDSTVSVLLVALVVVGAAGLAASGVIRRRSAAFSVGYVVYLAAVVLWISTRYRFPQRVSIAFLAIAALGLFVYLARAIADRPAASEAPARRAAVTLAVVAVLAFGWARCLIAWLDRAPWPHGAELQALEDRIAAREGFVLVHVQSGQVHHDPLRAVVRGYRHFVTGWGVFSATFYDQIAPLGVQRGADVLHAMVDNPEAYLLASMVARGLLEDWIRRQLHDPRVRLALVDAAAIADGGRPELYRVVTAPLARGTEEWQALERREAQLARQLPGPPDQGDVRFESVAFTAPYERYLSALRDQVHPIAIAPIDGGVRVEAAGEPTACTASGAVERVGVQIRPLAGLAAARFDIKLVAPEQVESLEVHARTASSRSIRWRWDREPVRRPLQLDGSITLVPGYPAHQLGLALADARPRDIVELHIFVTIKPGTRTGFELRNVAVAN